MGKLVPLGEVSPVTLLLGSVEVRIEVDDVSLQKLLSEFAGLKFFSGVTPLEFEVFLLSDISSDLG